MISVIGDSFTSGCGYIPWCDLLQEKLNTKVVNLNRQDMLTKPNVTSTNFFMMDRLEEFEMILQVSDLFIFQWTAPLRDDEHIRADSPSNLSINYEKREVQLLNDVWNRLEPLKINCPMIFWSWCDFSHLDKMSLSWYHRYNCGIKWDYNPKLVTYDGHPNQDGHEWISEKILSFIKKKNYLLNRKEINRCPTETII